MTDLARVPVDLEDGASVEDLLAALAELERPLPDRVAVYALLQQLRLQLDRGLKASRDDIIIEMERHGLKALGPVSLRSTAVDPTYPANDRANWGDITTQEAMAELRTSALTRAYVREVPAHYEIDVETLTSDVRMGVQAALNLYRELNKRGWRREVARRLSLEVRPSPREAA